MIIKLQPNGDIMMPTNTVDVSFEPSFEDTIEELLFVGVVYTFITLSAYFLVS